MTHSSRLFGLAIFLSAIVSAIFLSFFLAGCGAPRNANQVHVEKQGTDYVLMLNGSPFYIQGAGVGKAIGNNNENYLRMAKELGANTVRTWGTDQGTREYLDEAHRQGLYVNAGLWLSPAGEDEGVSYIRDAAYLQDKENEILNYVNRFKNHPAILLWNIGNEAIHFTKSEEERAALCKFLEKVIQKVHEADPHHPVVYTAANQSTFKYLKEHVPSLDVLGVNVYGSVIMAQSEWERLRFEIPYLISEYGPLGSWDLSKDENGKVVEQSDYAKAQSYKFMWKLIQERRGKNIGGLAFHLGETNQESLTFWNINDQEFKKEPYLVTRSLYTQQQIANHAPRVKTLRVEPVEEARGAAFRVTVTAEEREGEPMMYFYRASTTIEGVLKYDVNRQLPLTVDGEGSEVLVTLEDAEPGVYRIYATAVDPNGNAGTASATVRVQD